MSFDSQFEAQFSQLSNSQQQSSQSHNNRNSHFPFHSLSTVNHNSRLSYNNTNNQSSSQKSSSSQQNSQQSSSLFPRRNVANLSELFSMDPTRTMTSSSNNMGYNNNNNNNRSSQSSQSSQSSPLLSSRVPQTSSSSSFHSFLKQTKLYQNSQNNSSSQQQTLSSSSQLNHNSNNHHVHRASNSNNSNSSQKSIENQQEEMKNKQLIVFKLEHFEIVLNSILSQQTSSNEQLSEIKVEMVNQFELTRTILQDQSLLIQSLSEQLNQLSSLLNTTVQQLEKQLRDEKEAKEQQQEEEKRSSSREEETNMIEQWKMSIESCQKNWMETIQVQVTKLDQMIQMSQCHAIQSSTTAPCTKDSSSENHQSTNNNHCDSSTTPSETPRVNQEIQSAIVVVIDDENEELKTSLSDSCSDGASHSDEETSVTNQLERYLQKQIDSQWNNSALMSTDDCCSSFTLDGSDNDLWTTDIEEEEVKRAKKRTHLLMDDGIRESQHGKKGTSSGGRMISDHVIECEPIYSMNRRKKYRLF